MFTILLVAAVSYTTFFGLVAVPIALSNRHWLQRLGLFVVVSIVFALVPPVLAVRSEAAIGLAISMLLLCLAFVVESMPARITAIAIATAVAFLSFGMVPWNRFESTDCVRNLTAVGLLALLFGTFRVVGFRLVQMTKVRWETEFEIATGREMDAWCVWFRTNDFHNLRRSSQIALLRQQGIDCTWDQQLIDLCNLYCGLTPIERFKENSKKLFAKQYHESWQRSFRETLKATQFSIFQMLSWTTVLGAWFALLASHLGADGFLTADDILFGLVSLLIVFPVVSGMMLVELFVPTKTVVSLLAWGIPIFCAIVTLLATWSWLGSFESVIAVTISIVICWVIAFAGSSLAKARNWRILMCVKKGGDETANPKIANGQ
ncbi:hypothetical protein [Stieleria varia]|uniref:Uncharacterized protein n=1 Tax=Stieleria varia TaxID=2528005 RepID=A0A5C6BAM3_9BACT|nr:hypothetical protein [Stieleria varia]TWU07554.1 hypothetical protein Pla52n_01270 [Stieleria varia]